MSPRLRYGAQAKCGLVNWVWGALGSGCGTLDLDLRVSGYDSLRFHPSPFGQTYLI